MLYPAKSNPFSKELFENPTSEYRAAPFWSWNGKLNQKRMEEQIQVFHEMGYGGYHIHARIGLDTEYLGEEFMNLVKQCNAFGQERSMLTWLYDEDKWPSGGGGGRVTENVEYACRYLLLSPYQYADGYVDRHIPQLYRPTKNGDVTLLHRYDIELEDGKLVSYKHLSEGELGENVWYVYLCVPGKLPWFNNQPFVDLLNPDATKRFIEVTHQRYQEVVGEEFGKSIPCFFTDEPSFLDIENMKDSLVPENVGIVYTDKMGDYFKENYGHDLFDTLPEIFWERADGTLSQTRYQYYDCVTWMFTKGYAEPLEAWCRDHGLLLTGHSLAEENLEAQTSVAGEVMRCLSRFSLPGVDMLADRHEYSSVKQAQSVARQYDRVGVMSELYGVTNWDFDFSGHKHQGDWQAALGVTTRVPHLAWMSMAGESKRDYPAPLDEHSPWYKKYGMIEDYFARVNTALTRGKAHCRIGVMHPVESYWMLMGPDNDTVVRRNQLEQQFTQVTEALLFNLLDYDYICEALVPELYKPSSDATLHLGAMGYDVVVLPGMITMRSSTLATLKAFVAHGGEVVFMGEIPSYVDGKMSQQAVEFAGQCTCIGCDTPALLQALEPFRDVEMIGGNHLRSERLIYQLREDGQDKWLFIAQGMHDNRVKINHRDVVFGGEDFVLRVKGNYVAQAYHAMDGTVETYATKVDGDHTVMDVSLFPHDSLLLRLRSVDTELPSVATKVPEANMDASYLPAMVDYATDEPNVLMLDQAEYKLDDGPWMVKEEILRLDDKVRDICGYAKRTDAFPQPWLEPTQPIEHMVELRFCVLSDVAMDFVDLAFEAKSDVEITWNGQRVTRAKNAYYIDAEISRETLGALRVGENILEMKIPFGPAVNLEWCYLLGEFGVKIQGDHGVVIEKPQQVAFGSLTHQGFPFYGGQFQYHCPVTTAGGTVKLEFPAFKAALLEVEWNGAVEPVCFEPYCATFQNVTPGTHMVHVTAYINRINTFGQVHNCNPSELYFGPTSWRSKGKYWSYIYQLKDVGLVLTPMVYTK